MIESKGTARAPTHPTSSVEQSHECVVAVPGSLGYNDDVSASHLPKGSN